ncbi:splicing factor and tudor domain-containing protein [Cryptosporidium canis]|uniref:Splicing factor and tudor domain-containing protein n=1 Tax=Cryptosporidium canis TaxID=195482 RepID=A0ABQ8P262_9CRYT|nr:splicing factor and tudor domain-containing protein [Cryptosporidium canis]KAJ1605346.1 splicing factor and tudor domain-containing protein [Cryptosporidium canis]
MEIFQESHEELLERLEKNREQLEVVDSQLRELGPDDPDRGVLLEVRGDLQEVVRLVEELIESRKRSDASWADPNIGRVAEVFHRGTKRFGRIKSRDPSPDSSNYLISVFGKDSETISSPLQGLRLQPEFKGLSVGEKVQVLYEEDGGWYSSVIVSLTRSGYVIRYLEYDQEEAVSYDRVRLAPKSRPASTGTDTSSQQPDSSPLITTPAGYRIPESLLVKSCDSEKTRLDKRRKVSVIKKQQKDEILEARAREKQQSWKNHQIKFQRGGRAL